MSIIRQPGIIFNTGVGGGTLPANTVAPVASGTARVGETLSCTEGTWTGTPAPTFTYQWRRGGSNIASATNSTYVLVMADVGQAIDCNVTATNALGAVSQDSNNITLSAFLDAVIASTEFHLDATKTASYGGSGQTWANGVAAPASGAAQTDYDYWFGFDATVAAADYAFTGSAGDPAAYMLADGATDLFFMKAAGNTTFLDNVGKTTGGTPFWIVYAWRHIDGSTKINMATNAAAGNRGYRLESTAGESLQFQQRGDTTNVAHTIGALTNGSDYLAVYSSPAGGGTVRTALNAATFTEATHTWDATSTAPASRLTIAAEPDFGSPLPQNTRIYAVAMGNGYLTDALLAKIVEYFEHETVGHNRNYVA